MAPGTLLVPAYEDGGAAALGVEDMADDMQVKNEVSSVEFNTVPALAFDCHAKLHQRVDGKR